MPPAVAALARGDGAGIQGAAGQRRVARGGVDNMPGQQWQWQIAQLVVQDRAPGEGRGAGGAWPGVGDELEGKFEEVEWEAQVGYFEGYSEGYSAGYSVGYSAGYSVGYSDGYSEGYSPGYSAGYSAGYSPGYSAGYSDGYSAGYSDGYSDGYSAGYSPGYSAGYSAGYSDGYSEGYSAGYSAGYACQERSKIDLHANEPKQTQRHRRQYANGSNHQP
ncbi:MAG: hypothetical protein N838_35740 [Thiohalocapsa sp. PB-PSB1]|nr:MAG: hypothetical protein N838_35740 [Thiohalocapsa sp. PB-PSB1]